MKGLGGTLDDLDPNHDTGANPAVWVRQFLKSWENPCDGIMVDLLYEREKPIDLILPLLSGCGGR